MLLTSGAKEDLASIASNGCRPVGAMKTVVGLMSGTSMDGVDAAVLSTDGESIAGFGPTLFRLYDDGERGVLRQALVDARLLVDRTARTGALAEAERIVTDAHVMVIERLRAENPGLAPDLVGFHGQTVFHAPERRLTVQIGDGPTLARRLGIPVVYDFRAADVAAGGEGAPFVPAYHRALAARAGLAEIAVVNIGGVANLTRIGADGRLAAGDTGPGNALIDDFVRARTGMPLDRDGALAGQGRVDRSVLAELLDNPWFDAAFPKSLDRDAFSLDAVSALTTEDGAATLAAFTAETVAKGVRLAGGAHRVIVAGGGAHNPVLLRMLRDAASVPVSTAADLGWSVDFLEAQAFAFLAARSLADLPLSYPETTGVPRPMPGGVHVAP
jgi:anhydro-N-acetylmuramic acid kinase